MNLPDGLPPSGDADQIWEYLNVGLEYILFHLSEGLEYQRYMNLYT